VRTMKHLAGGKYTGRVNWSAYLIAHSKNLVTASVAFPDVGAT